MATSNSMSILHLTTLGTPKLFRDRAEVSLPARGLVLLAMLAQAPQRRLQRAYLAKFLWATSSEPRAKHSLSQLLHQLKSIGIVITPCGEDEDLTLETAVALDTDVLRGHLANNHIDAALRMYKGSFLESVILDSSAFEDWRSGHQQRIAAAIEDAVQIQVRYLYLRGELTKCRAFIDHVEHTLGEYWDGTVLPSAIQKAIVTADGILSINETPLVGRDFELELLYEAYEATANGKGTSLAVCSDAGQGKTALVSTFLKAAEGLGAVCIVARGYQPQRSVGFRVLRELATNEALAQHISELTYPHAKYLLTLAGVSGGFAQLDLEKRNFIFDGLARLIEVSCRKKPMVIFFDDVHWMDESSVEFLALLSRKCRDLPLLLISAFRPTGALHRLDTTRTLEVGMLSVSEVFKYVTKVVQARRPLLLSKAIIRRTAGHPYLIGQLVKAVSSDDDWTVKAIKDASPHSVQAFLSRQINGLSSSALLVFQAIVVLGKPTHAEVVRHVIRVSTGRFLVCLQELLDKNLVVDKGGLISCAHDLVREIAYVALSPTHRVTLHRMCAETLERRGANTGDVFFHLRRGRERQRTYLAALREARKNARLGAGIESNFYFRIAHSACTSKRKQIVISLHQARYALSFGLLRTARRQCTRLKKESRDFLRRRSAEIDYYLLDIDHELGSSDPQEVRARAKEVAASAVRYGDLRTQVNALILEGRSHLLDGYADESAVESVVARLMGLVQTNGYNKTTVEGITWAAGALVFMDRGTEADRLLGDANRWASTYPESRLHASIDACSALLASHRGELAKSVSLSRSAILHAEKHGLWRLRNSVLANLSGVLIEIADDDAARRALDELVRSGEIDQGLPNRVLAHTNYALLMLHKEELNQAQSHATIGLALAEKLQKPWAIAYTSAILGLVSLEQGSISDAIAHRDRVVALSSQYFGNDQSPMARLITRLGELEGRRESVVTTLEGIRKTHRLSVTSRAAITLDIARLLARTVPEEAHKLVMEVRDQARLAGAVRLYDASDAFETRLAAKMPRTAVNRSAY